MHFCDLFFPRRCAGCGKFGKYICVSCRRKIVYFDFQLCPGCRMPSYRGLTHNRCRKISYLDGIFAGAKYTGPVRKAIHLLKYRFVYDLVDELCGLLFQSLLPEYLISHYLIPVPLHVKRFRERGFNQAELIARYIGKKYKAAIAEKVLYRSSYTKPQFGLKSADRKTNVKDVFSVTNPGKIFAKKICLVDDVATTFSTLNQCAKALKNAGAAKVTAIVLAHGN